MVIGTDTIAVDTITLKTLNVDVNKHDLLLEAGNKRIGMADISKIAE